MLRLLILNPTQLYCMNKLTFLLFAIFSSGCVPTSQVMQVGPNSYTVTATSDGMRSAASARESALIEASIKCKSLGKEINMSSENSERTRMGIDTTYTVNFKCE